VTLAAGTKLGPYQVVAPLGAGGMGEVYRARDERLKRDVAIKVLPATYSQDADRLKRFEQEAQAAGALNHPNITAVHDFGMHDGAPYIVTELLEGETLRSRLGPGAISPRKAIDFAVQIAKGLAAAHEKGIVHRDLKPENVFLTKDGRVKILDFGLAKLKLDGAESGQTDAGTVSGGTQPGVVLGTMGYMAPEQVRGKPADKRSDLFSFGTILYEMLSGQRAFRGDTAADTITAILTKEPPDLSQTNKDIHPGLDRIVRHCLEKNPEERFESARDVAFDLDALSGVSTPTGAIAAPYASAKRRRVWPLVTGAVLATALFVGALAYLAGRKAGDQPPPDFRQLTFRRGEILSARFAPDGQTVVYSAAWDGKPVEVFVRRLESPESRPFGLPGTEVLAISRSGEMAVSLNRASSGGFRRSGTLAQLSVAGGAAPRDISEEVDWADWAPDGKSLAVVRAAKGHVRLEYPIGKVLYETGGWIGQPRVSSNGDLVAFTEHPSLTDDGGSVVLVDRSGRKKAVSKAFSSAQGISWGPNDSEVWFTAAEVAARALYSMSLSGTVRLRSRIAGNLTLRDISREGRMLVTRDTFREEILALAPGESKERDLTWLDYSLATSISADGGTVLFTEGGEGGGAGYSVYIRKTDGSPAVRIGEGFGQALSPDGKWAVAILHPATDPQLVIYPTGAGEPKLLSKEGLTVLNAGWMPDGKRILFTASEPGRGLRLYMRDLLGGKPRALTPEGYRGDRFVSPDGATTVVIGPDRRTYLYSISGGEPTAIPGLDANDRVDQFSADARSVYVHRQGEVPSRVYRVDLSTGRRELWRSLVPADAGGVSLIGPLPTPTGESYAYSYGRTLSDLYIVDGLR
jgi:eukaryotic-like serine/threonine-protein kinase